MKETLDKKRVSKMNQVIKKVGFTKGAVALSLFIVAGLLIFYADECLAEAGWQEEIRLTNDPADAITSPNNGKYILVDKDGAVHIVWADERDRNLEIYHKTRKNGIWSPDERLTNAPDDSKRPILALDAFGRVHLIWNDRRVGNKEIYHRIWNGSSWGPEERITFTEGDSFGPSVAVDSLTLHLVYMEVIDGYQQIVYRTYDGTQWSEPVPLTDIHTGKRMVPSIDIAPDKSLHVAWWDTREYPPGNENGKIYYREWKGSWLSEECISDTSCNAMRPSLAVDDSGFVHVAWINEVDSYDQIYYRMKDSDGWETAEAMTSGKYTHYHPSIDTMGMDIFLVYWDNHIYDTNSEVFFRRKVSGSWNGIERISNGEGPSTLCCIYAETNKNLHVGWVDGRDGNNEIYYREYIDPSNGVGDDGDDDDSGNENGDDVPFVAASLMVFPNPFSTSTRLMVNSSDRKKLEITLYDIDGRRVRRFHTYLDGSSTAGFVWDGTDGRGNRLCPGVYFVRCRIGKRQLFKKVIYLQ